MMVTAERTGRVQTWAMMREALVVRLRKFLDNTETSERAALADRVMNDRDWLRFRNGYTRAALLRDMESHPEVQRVWQEGLRR